MSSTKHNLQPQQQLAVSLYMKSMNKTQAAKDAGYSGTSVFNSASVKAAINEQMLIRAERLRIGADWVLKESVKVYERCMQLELVTVKDREGLPLGEFRFDAANAIKALTLIGKHVDVKAFDEPNVEIDTDREILERLRRGRERLNEIATPGELPSVSFLEPIHETTMETTLPEEEFTDETISSKSRYVSDNVTTEIDVMTSEQKLQEFLTHMSKNNRERSE